MSPVLKIDQLTYYYPEQEQTPALSNVSLTIEEGEWVAIVGRNGSGKSTLAKLIHGFLTPKSGSISIFGKEVTETSIWELRQEMGIVFQNPDNQFVGATVEDDVAFGLENRGVPRDEMRRRVQEALDEVGMLSFKKREPGYLSGGQKQRVAIAGVLAMQPRFVIFDEATSMLDPKGRATVLKLIHQLRAKYQLTIVSITHDISEAILADRVIVLKDGVKQAEGSPSEVFTQQAPLESYGLQPPFAQTVTSLLIQEGYQPPKDYMTETDVEEWLWTLRLMP